VAVLRGIRGTFAAYMRERDGTYHAHEILVPALTKTGIARIIVFLNPGLFAMFGLPQEYARPGG
jgi:RNA polymerase sigma-70 factor, ECF subfamily